MGIQREYGESLLRIIGGQYEKLPFCYLLLIHAARRTKVRAWKFSELTSPTVLSSKPLNPGS